MNRETFRKLFSTISDLHFLSSIFKGLFSGHDAPDEANDMVKGMSGMFGFADERRMLILLMALDQRTPGAADTVLNYLTRHYSTEGLGWEAKVYVMRQKYRFRDMVVDMGSSDGTKTGEATTTVNGRADGHSFKHVRKEDVRSSGRNNSLELLVRMHSILAGTGSVDELDEKCTRFLLSAGAPMVDREFATRLSGVSARLAQQARELFDTIIKRAGERGADVKTILQRLNVNATNQVGRLANQLEEAHDELVYRRSFGRRVYDFFMGNK